MPRACTNAWATPRTRSATTTPTGGCSGEHAWPKGAVKSSNARVWAVLALFAATAWLLRPLAGAIAGACLIAVGTWPLHDRLQARIGARAPATSAALLTAVAVLVLLGPLLFVVIEGLREAPRLLHLWGTSQNTGLAVPPWLEHLPLIGAWAVREWDAQLAEPGALRELLHGLAARLDVHAGSAVARGIGHRAMAAFFCILVLYLLYRDGRRLGAQARAVVARWLGAPGLRTLDLAVHAIRGTVNGLLLVALLLAVVLGIGYAIAGVPHAVFWGLLTGVLGTVPFGSAVALAGVALYLVAVDAPVTALVLLGIGGAVIFVVDHAVRPYFVSGPARVPFVLALLGIVGGLEAFGLLGVFVGPTLVAIAVAVWRELVQASEREPRADPGAGETPS
jgi:predicted PurR-regulated permease PerM